MYVCVCVFMCVCVRIFVVGCTDRVGVLEPFKS